MVMAGAVSMNGDGGHSNNNENINREEIKAAIAKAVELRALHASLMHTNNTSPAHLRFLSSSASPPPPFSRPSSHFSAHDYPVFTPSYEDEPLSGYGQTQMISQNWNERRIIADSENEVDEQELIHLDYTRPNSLLRNKGLPNSDSHNCPIDDNKSVASLCTNYTAVFLHTSPGVETVKSRRRNSLGDLKSVSSCNKCKPATISTDNNNNNKTDNKASSKHSNNMVVPLTDSHASISSSQTKSRGTMLSWLLPKFKRRPKNEGGSPARTESEDVSQVLKDLGIVSVETLKKELIEANQKRDIALMEVSDMRSLFGELRKKLENLESYCEELKKALSQAVQTNSSLGNENLGSLSTRGGQIDGNNREDGSMPVSEEVMVEGFLQIVSEARLSVKQFCKTLAGEIEETDEHLMENLNQVLKPYKLSINSRYSKSFFYHLEAIINQAFFQDFENCVFQKNGTPKILDPEQDRQQQFQSFVALRNLSWNEVLKKGTKYYSEEFSKFCDQKMSCIIMTLNWTRPWAEHLLQSFFVAAKCIWLLHLLAFSFNPCLTILRVEENRQFDPHYMEDMLIDKQKVSGPSRVKIMVMPGFYVHDKILRCKVLCRYKSLA